MGEQNFVKYTINSLVDVQVVSAGLPAQIAEAGSIAKLAVQEATEAALAGDQAATAKAKEKLSQALDSLEGLGQVQIQLNEFSTKGLA